MPDFVNFYLFNHGYICYNGTTDKRRRRTMANKKLKLLYLARFMARQTDEQAIRRTQRRDIKLAACVQHTFRTKRIDL